MTEKTHWLQNPNKNYLGHWDLPEDEDLTLTIKSAEWESVENPVTHKEEACRVVRWEEDYKPLICNQTNSQSIIKSTGQNYMEDSAGCKVKLYLDRVMNQKEKEEVDCVRIRRTEVKIAKPVLNPESNSWKAAQEKAKNPDVTIESIRKHYEISDADFKLLKA